MLYILADKLQEIQVKNCEQIIKYTLKVKIKL